MGADLICYIAFGPTQIDADESKVTEIARQVRGYMDACIAAAEQLLLGQEKVQDPRPEPVEAKRSVTFRLETSPKEQPQKFNSLEQLRSDPGYQGLIHDALIGCDREVEAEHVFTSTVESLADEVRTFVSRWNKGSVRDMASREDPQDPGRKVVVAGDLSWGDEPDGAGYQLLKKAFGLTIAQLLGVE